MDDDLSSNNDTQNDHPVSLRQMVIGSVDTLRETQLSQHILPPTWNDQPPLLRQQQSGNMPESPALLKGVRNKTRMRGMRRGMMRLVSVACVSRAQTRQQQQQQQQQQPRYCVEFVMVALHHFSHDDDDDDSHTPLFFCFVAIFLFLFFGMQLPAYTQNHCHTTTITHINITILLLLLATQMLRRGIPPPLRCAVWLSNVMQAVHPHEEAAYWHEYRTLAKVQALEHAYETFLQSIVESPQDWETIPVPTFGANYNHNHKTNSTTTTTTTTSTSDDDDHHRIILLLPGTTPAGALAHQRVLVALHRLLSGGGGSSVVVDNYHAPALPALVALLLTHQSEAYAFCVVREMSHCSHQYYAVGGSRRQPGRRRRMVVQHVAWTRAFGHVLTKLHPQTAEYLEDRGVLETVGVHVFQNLFTDILPLEDCCRIMDLYTLEGAKVLFRFGVALLVLFKKESAEQLLTISNADDWWHYFRQWTSMTETTSQPIRGSYDFERVVRKAYGVHGSGGTGRRGMMRRPLGFPRRNILSRIIRMEESLLLQEQVESGEFDTTDGELVVPPSQPLGLVLPQSDKQPKPVLAATRQARLKLAEWMPLTLRYTNLDLLYSTNHHGRSLDMFYRCVKHAKHTIILCEVLSMEKQQTAPGGVVVVVGMYASQAWRSCTQVYGDGACFLFRLQPNPHGWKWSPRPPPNRRGSLLESVEQEEEQQRRNNATALLEQFMVSTPTYLSMGGNPDGSAGLRLNEDFTVGESSTAVGFDNEPLHGVGHGSVFQVGLVEVYGLTREIDGKAL